MRHHAAYGLTLEDLDIVVVEDSKPMQLIIRSTLLSFKVSRVRVFDSVDEALQSMLAEPPNVILTDWRMEPTSGYQLLRLVRHRHMEPLCYVPVLFITAHGTRALVDKALRAGAHHLLVKPVSPSTLHTHLRWLLTDERPMTLEPSGFYTIDGVHKALDAAQEKMQTLDNARAYHEQATRKYAEMQNAVEEVFSGEEAEAAEEAEPAPAPEVAAEQGERRRRSRRVRPVPQPNAGNPFAALRNARK